MNATSRIGSFLKPWFAAMQERHSSRWRMPRPRCRGPVSHGSIYYGIPNLRRGFLSGADAGAEGRRKDGKGRVAHHTTGIATIYH